MHKSKIKQISLAVCLALMPFSGFAAGLGKLNVNSGLGEPLKADIELLSVTPEELSTLVAVIASEEAYADQGITRLGIHNSIKVEITKDATGSPILKLRSNQPVSDPYLDMLIQVDWASGRLQREYTILLDPPEYKSSADSAGPINVVPPSVSIPDNNRLPGSSASSSAIDTAQPSVKKAKKLRSSADQTAVAENESAGVQELITVRGDTLSSIAKELQVEGVSLDQMLVGLYENNKESFSNGNMNRLKIGQIIKVPSKETLTAFDTQQAKQSVKVHSANWNAYRNSLAGTVAEAPAMQETELKQSASGKIATAEDKAALVKVGPQDVVKLSAGEKDVGNGGKGDDKSFNAKIVALQEEATAREKSLAEAQERTAALEKQIQDMQKLLALKSQSMTELQKNAEVAAETQDTPDAEVATPTESKPVATIPEVKTAAPPPQVKPETQPEPSLLEGLTSAVDLTVLGGVSVVALLGAGWMFLRNKRRKNLDSFERGILTSGGLRANTVFGNTTGNASTSDTSFLTDFAQSADGSMIDTNDVDPIAEAEVYMAYGRDAQAEEILKDAISKEPKRYELHLKLLEMYAARKDISAFEAIAGELYTTLGADDPTWAKVAEIGATMEPGNPLYDVRKVVAATSIATQKLDASDFTDSAVLTDTDLNLSFDSDSSAVAEDANSVVMQSFSAAQNVEQDISFDLGTADGDSIAPVSLENSGVTQKADEGITDNTLSFNSTNDNSMDFDLGDMSSVATGEPAELNVMDDLPAFEATKNAGDDFEAHVLDLSAMNENAGNQPNDFDMDFSLPADATESGLEQKSETASNVMDDISFDLDFALDVPSQSAVTEPDMTASEISFDIPLGDEIEMNEASVAASQTSEPEANAFDLSSISLDLDEAKAESMAEQPITQNLIEPTKPDTVSLEPQDVEIKLDLVAAYIDMDDKEGARELLEEVVKEGGMQQQLRAQKLLDSLA